MVWKEKGARSIPYMDTVAAEMSAPLVANQQRQEEHTPVLEMGTLIKCGLHSL